MTHPDFLWHPSETFRQQSNLHAYEDWLHTNLGIRFANYHAIWEWSVTEPDAFWKSIWDYFGVQHDGTYGEVLSTLQMPGACWFDGTRLNYAEHIFRHRHAEVPALWYVSEVQKPVAMSWHELEIRVNAFKYFLWKQGIRPGDRVAAYIPNVPEAVIAFLATSAIGGIWSCCSPDFGSSTVIDRFEQIAPKVFIGIDGYQYNGKPYSRWEESSYIVSRLSSVHTRVMLQQHAASTELPEGWKDFHSILENQQVTSPLTFERVPFDQPLWILYSSGTTGKPKAITHSHGGVLLEHLKYLTFHNDVMPGENFFWYTTTGWMMWNFLVASMLAGGVPVLFDGSPGYPNLDALWKLSEALPIHHFGTSAPYLIACMKADLHPGVSFDLQQLRSIGSTGAPLPAEAFDWVYSAVGSHIWLCSMSGGTDVCTAFVGCNPYLPVSRGHIQCRCLGCALYAYDAEGKRVEAALGEMVIEKPMPSMPIYFWNDPGNKRMLASYFDTFPGKWRHGDWIKIFADGSLVIQGRSDATLNRKGIRIGTAEIYAALDGLAAVKDSLVLNLEREDGDDIMPLFVVLTDDAFLDDDLKKHIQSRIREVCSPRHVPDLIQQVDDIPYTLSGKKMEVPVKKIFMGMPADIQRDAIRNPEALDDFTALAAKFRQST